MVEPTEELVEPSQEHGNILVAENSLENLKKLVIESVNDCGSETFEITPNVSPKITMETRVINTEKPYEQMNKIFEPTTNILESENQICEDIINDTKPSY